MSLKLEKGCQSTKSVKNSIYFSHHQIHVHIHRGVARRYFKSSHNVIHESSLEVMAPGKPKVECPCRRTGGEWGGAEYATEHHIFNFLEMNVLNLF